MNDWVEIISDGIDFSHKDISLGYQNGLRGMRERSDLIGAEFQIISQPGKGTSVVISTPIAKQIEEEIY